MSNQPNANSPATLLITLLAMLCAWVPVGAQKEQQPQQDRAATRSIEGRPISGGGGTGGSDWDGDFASIFLRVDTDRSEYTVGDPVRITVRANETAHVYVFSTNDRGETRLLFPNHYDRENRLNGGQSKRLPGSQYRLVATGDGWNRIDAIAVDVRGTNWRPPTIARTSSSDPFPLVRGGVASARRILRDSLADAATRGGTRLQSSSSDGSSTNITHRAVTRGRTTATPFYGEDNTDVFIRPRRDEPINPVRPLPPGYYPPNYYPPNYFPPGYYQPPGRPVPPPRNQRDGEVRIDSTPTRADVYIDGFYYGTTPITIALPPGRYEVELYRRGYRDWRRWIRVEEDGRERISVRLQRD